MVNQLHIIKDRVVKAEKADAKLPRVTAKGGLAAAQALARRQGLWNIVKTCFPARKDATRGFQMEACVSSLVFGLLSGGKGFSATEPMRGDDPLLLRFSPKFTNENVPKQLILLMLVPISSVNCMANPFFANC